MMLWHFAVTVNTFLLRKTFKLSHIFLFSSGFHLKHASGSEIFTTWMARKELKRNRQAKSNTAYSSTFNRALIYSPKFDGDFVPLASLALCSVSWGSCEGECIHGEGKEQYLTLLYKLHLNNFSSALKLCQVHKDPPSKRKVVKEGRKRRVTRKKSQFK